MVNKFCLAMLRSTDIVHNCVVFDLRWHILHELIPCGQHLMAKRKGCVNISWSKLISMLKQATVCDLRIYLNLTCLAVVCVNAVADPARKGVPRIIFRVKWWRCKVTLHEQSIAWAEQGYMQQWVGPRSFLGFLMLKYAFSHISRDSFSLISDT